nr:hypothetical protein CFP56_10426 [Quercus suber]
MRSAGTYIQQIIGMFTHRKAADTKARRRVASHDRPLVMAGPLTAPKHYEFCFFMLGSRRIPSNAEIRSQSCVRYLLATVP